MAENDHLTLRTEGLLKKAGAYYQKYSAVILSSLLLGFLCHMFMLTNKLINHDELYNLFSIGIGTTGSGRWVLDLLVRIIPCYSMPWFQGTVSILMITLASCLIVRIFQIHRPVLQILTSGLIITFPSLTATFCYMFTSGIYSAALFLSVLTAYLIIQKKPWSSFSALVCGILSLSIYQAYFAITAGILVLYLLQQTMFTDVPVKKIFLSGIFFAGSLLVCLIGYWIIFQVSQSLLQMPINPYSDEAIHSDRSVFQRIKDVLISYYAMFKYGRYGIIPTGFSRLLHIVLGVIVGIEMLLWCLDTRNCQRILMMLLLILVFPFAIAYFVLVVSLSSIHTLVFYSFVCIYLLCVVVLEGRILQISGRHWLNRVREGLMDLSLGAMAVLICTNIFIANEAYLHLYLNNTRNLSLATTLITQAESFPDYHEDTPVGILGTYPQKFPDHFAEISNMMGPGGFSTAEFSYYRYFDYYCGTKLKKMDDSELAAISSRPEVTEMPVYPNHGCMKMIDGSLIIKFPEP